MTHGTRVQPGAGLVVGLATAALLTLAGAALAGTDRGFPVIAVVTPPATQPVTQVFGIATDSDGILHLATLGGVVSYDGAWWTSTPAANGSAAWSVAVDARGRVAVGAVDELGWLVEDEHGTAVYRSLVPRLPAAERALAEVAATHVLADGGFVYRSARRLVRWRGERLETLTELAAESTSFASNGEIYVWQRGRGLERLAGNGLVPVAGGRALAERRVALALPADGDDGLLLAIDGEGLHTLAAGILSPFAPQASAWAVASEVTSGCRLRDGRWALGSHRGGLLLLGADGTVEQIIDQAAGLPEDYVAGMVESPDGALWVAFDRGDLARVEVALPLSVLDARAGLRGSVYDVVRHQGELWVATSAGLFTTQGVAATPGAAARAQLRAIAEVPATAWSLLPDGEALLVGTSNGVHQVSGGRATVIPGSEQVVAYRLAASCDPDRVWLGEREGLGILRREAQRWRRTGQVAGVPRYARSIVERPGVLWVATTFEGIYRLDLVGGIAGEPRLTAAAGDTELELNLIDGRVVASDGERVLQLDETSGALVADPRLRALAGHGVVLEVAQDRAGNVWLSTTPPVVAMRREAGYPTVARPLAAVPLRRTTSVAVSPDGTVWVGTDEGLLRWQGTVIPSAPPPPPRVARVLAGPGEVLFGGAAWLRAGSYVLPAGTRRLRVELAPGGAQPGLSFQSWLEPVDEGWNGPTADPFVELGQLPAGDYTLRVRALGPDHVAGEEAALAFAVLAPWYRTGGATVAWGLLLALVLVGYPRLRLRAVRARARDLEAQVDAHTVALRRTVAELQRAQAQVEETNALLRAANQRLDAQSRHDALTGLANRRHFDETLGAEWERARRQRAPLALVLLDLDHFKRLNDERGHPEGDACLRQVGAVLRARAQRPGDLAARYGGEELAILLPGTGATGAEELAEQTRAAIEELAIPHPSSPATVVTASFGVAVVVPQASDSPATLVEAADAALYRAKSDGRNRVRSAAPPTTPAD